MQKRWGSESERSAVLPTSQLASIGPLLCEQKAGGAASPVEPTEGGTSLIGAMKNARQPCPRRTRVLVPSGDDPPSDESMSAASRAPIPTDPDLRRAKYVRILVLLGQVEGLPYKVWIEASTTGGI